MSSSDWNIFNNKIDLTSLSGTGGIAYNNSTVVFSDLLTFTDGLVRVGNNVGLALGASGEVLTMSGGVITWMTPEVVSIPVLSIFGRTGSIVGQSGDYTTTLVTEGSNLYFTDSRAQNAL